MNIEEEEKKHFAVLIDADNISEKYAASIFNELRITVMRPTAVFTETGRKETAGRRTLFWKTPSTPSSSSTIQ